MSGRIISLHGDEHDGIGMLLPWYVTGRLDANERGRVEAHLRGCVACQTDLEAERRLHAVVADRIDTDGDADAGWTRIRRQVTAEPLPPRAAVVPRWWANPVWLRGLIAAQFVLLVIGAGWFVQSMGRPQPAPPQYHALSSAPVMPHGNIIVVFSPDASERRLRDILRASHARLVDGPTAADAYILSVPQAQRTEALARLRDDTAVMVAEPIDGDGR